MRYCSYFLLLIVYGGNLKNNQREKMVTYIGQQSEEQQPGNYRKEKDAFKVLGKTQRIG